MNFLNSCSSSTRTPSSSAFSYLDPGLSPATTKSVSLETKLETLPPRERIFSLASSLLILGRVPVKTKVLPTNLTFEVDGPEKGESWIFTCLRSLSKIFIFSLPLNQSIVARSIIDWFKGKENIKILDKILKVSLGFSHA